MSIFEKFRKKHTPEQDSTATEVAGEQNLVPESESQTVSEPRKDIPLDKLNHRVVAAIREMRMQKLVDEPGPGVVRNSRYAEEMDRDATAEELKAVLAEVPSEEEEVPEERPEQPSKVSVGIGQSVTDYVVPTERKD